MRRLERRLNRFPNLKTEVDGLGIHYIHVRSPKAGRPAGDHDPRLAGIRGGVP